MVFAAGGFFVPAAIILLLPALSDKLV